MGSAMASMPHYMSQGVNELAATGVEKGVNGLMSMLFMSVTGVEEIVVFYINMLTSTYLCLITLAVSGSLHVALQVAEDVSNFLNKTLGGIQSDIQGDVNSFQADLNKFVSALNSVPEVLGGQGSIPTLNVNASLAQLDNITLPSSLDEGLTKLNSSIPNFSQVQNFTDNVIRAPFEEVKNLINQSMTGFQFDRSILPVPQKEQLTFCSDNNSISDFFLDLAELANLARRIFIGVLTVLAILLCIPMAYREIRRWRILHRRAQIAHDNSIDPVDVIYIGSRPYTSTAGIKLASRFSSTKMQILVRWVVAYATSPPALFILSLGLAGLFSCLCQYILLKTVEKEVPALANEVGDFAGKVIDTLNNASQNWATGTNDAIATVNTDMNKDIFGWVNTTTGALNNTLNAFVDQMTDALNTTFGGTVLYTPILDVMNCLVGLKIAGIQKGLDWVSDNAHVDFPSLPNNTFTIGALASIASNNSNASDSFLASPSSDATDDITNAIDLVALHIQDAIRTEALVSMGVVLVWVILVLGGFFRAMYLALARDKNRGEGGASFAGDIPLETQQSMPPAPAYEPPRDSSIIATNPFADGNANNHFPSFATAAPAPSRPRRSDHEREEEWQDQKLGFAGDRGKVGNAIGEGYGGRGSSYGFISEEKS